LVPVKIPEKVYVRLYAGMGDFFKRYFLQCTWQCLEDLKAKHPEVKINALLASQTVPALDLVDHHPCIDEVVKPMLHTKQVKEMGPEHFMGDHVPLSNRMAQQFELKMPPIYLSESDEVFVDAIQVAANHKYIVVHPFSGDIIGNTTRSPLKPARYAPIVRALVESGYSVVLLGSSWSRLLPEARKPGRTRMIEEKFNWETTGLVNLIDKTNIRTAVELVKRSNGFVGTASSFMCAAWSLGSVRSVILTSERWREPLTNMVWAKDRIKEPQNKVVYIPKNRTPQTFQDIETETAGWFE
jgi:ADP-heptose:LPS heptosyltransferase